MEILLANGRRTINSHSLGRRRRTISAKLKPGHSHLPGLNQGGSSRPLAIMSGRLPFDSMSTPEEVFQAMNSTKRNARIITIRMDGRRAFCHPSWAELGEQVGVAAGSRAQHSRHRMTLDALLRPDVSTISRDRTGDEQRKVRPYRTANTLLSDSQKSHVVPTVGLTSLDSEANRGQVCSGVQHGNAELIGSRG